MAEISEADSPLDESRFVRFPDSPFQLCQLFEPAVDQRRLIDGLRGLRVPRQLFKFLYRLLVAHCHAHTGEQAVYKIPLERFDTVLAVFRREQDAFDRGLAPR